MIQVLVGYHPGKQARCGHAAIDHSGWNGLGCSRFAAFACVLRANVTMNKESGRFYIELSGHVFTHFNQIAATLTALTGLWFMAMFNTGQMIRRG